jgi:hypothetical protein
MVNLQSGTTFNKIVKKGTDYSVGTPPQSPGGAPAPLLS